MPYKDPERKRQWEREHREQRNARRRTQRLDAWSGLPTVSKATSDIAAALGTSRKPAPDLILSQKPKSTWKTTVAWAVGIGVVLLALFAGASPPDPGMHGSGT